MEHHVGVKSKDLEQIEQEQTSPVSKHPLVGIHLTALGILEANRPMITIGKKESIKEVFHKLVDNGILSLPVYDNHKGLYTKFVDVLDVLVYTVNVLSADITKSGYETICSHPEFNASCEKLADASHRNPFYSIDSEANLKDAVDLMAKKKLYRLAVTHKTGDLAEILTQSRVVRWISGMVDVFPFAHKTIEDFNLGNKGVISVATTQDAIQGFCKILENNITGVAVVNEDGKLVANLSASDLRRLGYGTYLFAHLFLPVQAFLTLGDNEIRKPVVIKQSTTIKEVFQTFNWSKVHRLYVVDEHHRPVGVVSVTDMIRLLASELD